MTTGEDHKVRGQPPPSLPRARSRDTRTSSSQQKGNPQTLKGEVGIQVVNLSRGHKFRGPTKPQHFQNVGRQSKPDALIALAAPHHPLRSHPELRARSETELSVTAVWYILDVGSTPNRSTGPELLFPNPTLAVTIEDPFKLKFDEDGPCKGFHFNSQRSPLA